MVVLVWGIVVLMFGLLFVCWLGSCVLRFGFPMLWLLDWFCWFGLLFLVVFLFVLRDVVFGVLHFVTLFRACLVLYFGFSIFGFWVAVGYGLVWFWGFGLDCCLWVFRYVVICVAGFMT